MQCDHDAWFELNHNLSTSFTWWLIFYSYPKLVVFFVGFPIQCVNARECDFFAAAVAILFSLIHCVLSHFISFVCLLLEIGLTLVFWLMTVFFFECKYDEYKVAKVILRASDLKHLCIMSAKKGWRYCVVVMVVAVLILLLLLCPFSLSSVGGIFVSWLHKCTSTFVFILCTLFHKMTTYSRRT